MPQQILDGDRPVERDKRKARLAVLAALLNTDLHVGKGRNVFRDGIAERKLALLHEHHRGNGRDRFRHRVKAKDRVRAHGQFRRDVAAAEILEIDRLAVLLEQQDRAGKRAGRDLVPDVVGDFRQALGRQAVHAAFGARLRADDAKQEDKRRNQRAAPLAQPKRLCRQ